MNEEERQRIERGDPDAMTEILIPLFFAIGLLLLLGFILCGVL